MKNTLFVFFLYLFSIKVSAQGWFDMVLGTGHYTSPDYQTVVPKMNVLDASFEYHHKKKLIFSAGILTSNYHYRFTYPNNSPIISIVNGIPVRRGRQLQSNFMFKYKVLNKEKYTFQIGTGIGLLTLSNEQTLRVSTSAINIITSFTDIGFPLSAEFYAPIYRRFLIGFKAGSFIFPDYPIVGNNISLQVRYRLKN